MKHIVDALALTKVVAEKGNTNSISDAGVSALMLYAAAEGAALNVKINLSGITDQEFVGWHAEEVSSIIRTCKNMSEEILDVVRKKINT
jgi:formiminotetrahydrofolate cyclodeaminase